MKTRSKTKLGNEFNEKKTDEEKNGTNKRVHPQADVGKKRRSNNKENKDRKNVKQKNVEILKKPLEIEVETTIKEIDTKKSKKEKKDQCKSNADDNIDDVGFNDEICYINKMIENLLKTHEASSLIVCGDAGIGKTKLIQTCLSSFPIIMGKDDPNYNHLKVELFQFDGIIHGDNDLSAIRLIGSRLNKFLEENNNDDNEDMLNVEKNVINSIPKIMSQLRLLTENYENFRSIIVLENFDIFCRKQQTLLYNILDLTQHGRSIFVIGTTRRVDFLELLEKRVRSRLTQRTVNLTTPFKNFDLFKKYCYSRIKYFCQQQPELEPNYKANEASIEKQLQRSFAINPNFIEIDRIVVQNSFYWPSNNSIVIDDPKILALSQLNQASLILIVIIIRNLKNQDVKIFTCYELYQWTFRIPLLPKNNRMGLIIKSMYKLIDNDLVIYEKDLCQRRKTVKRDSFSGLNKWTKLVPNVTENQLEEFIKKFEQKIPEFIKQFY